MNWYTKLNAFFSPSITLAEALANQGNGIGISPVAAPPSPITGAPRSTAYKPNPFTMAQLAQFQPQQGLLSAQNPIYQQYLAKMAGYGAGAGKTAPSQTTQGANNG